MHAVLGAVTGLLSGHETWVGDGRVGFLRHGATMIIGHWRQRYDVWEFRPDNHDQIPVVVALSAWEVLDGYWGGRAAIVLDETRPWHKAHFSATDSIWWKRNTEGELTSEVVKDGWDHEHCAICWEKIGACGQPEGYVSNRTWVCEHCYTKFVRQRSLEFIPTT